MGKSAIYIQGSIQIAEKIAKEWQKNEDGSFTADNLKIYYREEFKEWRLKDTALLTTLDITDIPIPLTDKEIERVKNHCSRNHIASTPKPQWGAKVRRNLLNTK